jgi:RNA polymerase sigma-70 factor (TIGR02957 family)
VTHEDLRPLMLSIAYRMVGSFSEAEDIVQEAFLRLAAAEDAVEAPKAWLTTVTTRLSIDHLRSARVRREQYPGTWLPEPLLADPAPDAAARAETADTLSLALLVVLESLSPVERAVFLLREVFDYGYDEIAEIVDRSEDNCRQLAVRARRHVEARRPRFEPSREQREELARRFFAAVQEGETEPLVELLAADVAFYGDGGGKAPAIGKPVFGAEKVVDLLLGFARVALRQGARVEPIEVNGQPGALALDADGSLISVMALDISGGAITAIRSIPNPDKIAHISSTILPSLPPDLKRS